MSDEQEMNNNGSEDISGVHSAVEGFISRLTAYQQSLFDSEEKRRMQQYIDTLKRQINNLEIDLNECESRDCIEDDPDSVENMSHYNDARDSSGYL